MATGAGSRDAAAEVKPTAPVLSRLAALGLFVGALVQLEQLFQSTLLDEEFLGITCALAAAAGVATLLRSGTARMVVTAAAIGGFVSVAFWPPWAMLDTEHPSVAWTGLAVLVLMGASLAAGWRERRLPTGSTIYWQLFAGAAAGFIVVFAILYALLAWALMTSSL
jgi:hypothetical protein